MKSTTLQSLIALLLGIAIPFFTYITQGGLTFAHDWPTMVAAGLILIYSAAKSGIPAGDANLFYTIVGVLVTALLATQTALNGGPLTGGGIIAVVLPAVIGVLDGNPNSENVIVGAFQKLGQTYTKPS